jgi:hypothetical protein
MKKPLFFLLFMTSLTQPLLADTSLPCHPLPSHRLGQERFCYHSHPINPACVDSMVGDLRGGTDVVNLSKCEAKNRHNDFGATYDGAKASGWHSLTYGRSFKNEYDEYQSYSYKVIGRTANGNFVVNTYSDGGGSGVFNNLALFHIFHDADDQEYLAWVGSLAGGDRALGSVIAGTVTMKGTHVMGLRESDKNTTPIPTHEPQKFDFDLSKIPT